MTEGSECITSGGHTHLRRAARVDGNAAASVSGRRDGTEDHHSIANEGQRENIITSIHSFPACAKYLLFYSWKMKQLTALIHIYIYIFVKRNNTFYWRQFMLRFKKMTGSEHRRIVATDTWRPPNIKKKKTWFCPSMKWHIRKQKRHQFQQTCCGCGCSFTNLTPVIMGALFDLRRAPPPAPPAAPAHWSTSIRSIPLVGRPGRGGTCCRPPIPWRRCRALLEHGESLTCRPHEP